jgi:hypothetical protein
MVREAAGRALPAAPEALSSCYSSVGTATLYRAPIGARVAVGRMPGFPEN